MSERSSASPPNVKPGIHKGAAPEPLYAPSAQDIKLKNVRRTFFFLIKNSKFPVYFFHTMIYNIKIENYVSPKDDDRKEKESHADSRECCHRLKAARPLL